MSRIEGFHSGITSLAEELERKLQAHDHVHDNPFLTISVVPAHSRAMDDGRYTPLHVSIGPYHWGSSQLRREAEKVWYLRRLLDHHGQPRSRADLRSLLEKLKQQLMDRRILECYGFDKKRPIDELVMMLLLDGCYLIAHCTNPQPQIGRDPSPGQQRTTSVQVPSASVRSVCGKLRDCLAGIRTMLSCSAAAGCAHDPQSSPRSNEPAPSSSGIELQQIGSSSRNPPSTSSSSNEGLLQSRPSAQAQQGGNGHSASGTSSGSRRSSRSSELQQVGESSTSSREDDNWAVLVRDTWYLLENQIPFVMVEKVYELTTGTGHADMDGVRTAFRSYAKRLLEAQLYIYRRPTQEEDSSPHHLLHILHSFFKPRPRNAQLDPEGTASVVGPWRRATEYVRHGNVQFIRQPLDGTKALSVLDIGMEGGKVHLPRLHIDSNTWTILLNLRALEQQHPSLGTYVTAYCLFMSQMASTAEDVELLMRHGVLEHSLGVADNVAAGFVELCSGVVLDTDDIHRNYLKPIWLLLEKGYKSSWHNFLSWFRINYWSWRNLPVVIAVVVGFIVLASELVSAVFQALSYYQQDRNHK